MPVQTSLTLRALHRVTLSANGFVVPELRLQADELPAVERIGYRVVDTYPGNRWGEFKHLIQATDGTYYLASLS